MGRKQVTVYDALEALILEKGLSCIYENKDLSKFRENITHSEFNAIMMENDITTNQRKMGEFWSLITDLGIFKEINRSDSRYVILSRLQEVMKRHNTHLREEKPNLKEEQRKTLPTTIKEETIV